MDGTHLYIIFPESNPYSTPWTNSNEIYLEDAQFIDFIKELELQLLGIRNENYYGKYDSENISSFLNDLTVLEDLYPNPPKKIVRSILKNFVNWREEHVNFLTGHTIYGQAITDHLFCKMSNHFNALEGNENLALLNHKAININNDIEILSNNINARIPNLNTPEKLRVWFHTNRIPAREFHDTQKHRAENRGNWDNASPLKCNLDEAQKLLNSAIGDKDTLYNLDNDNNCWIKFMFDNAYGKSGQRLYHGYSLNINTQEIPEKIKRQLR